MFTLTPPKWLTLLSITLLTLAGVLFACQVPVFRYALERWESDEYQLFLVSPEPLTTEERNVVDDFKKSLPNTNLSFTEIELSTMSEADLWKLPEIDTSITTPRLFLFPPEKHNKTSPIIVEPLSKKSLSSILDSPARRQIVQSLIEGQSCVWLILHNGQLDKATALQATLDKHLEAAASTITLPEGIIGTEQRGEINQNTDLDDVLRSSIPLKIAFTSQTLDSQTEGEATFVATLLEGLPQSIKQLDEPLIFPIFGRGRKVTPIVASELSYQTVLNGSHYLCGACSCQVKEQNPGNDLLISEDWPKYLTEGLAIVEKELPPLSGLGDVSASPTTDIAPATAATVNSHNPNSHNPNSNWLLIIAGSLVLLVIAGSSILILRKNS